MKAPTLILIIALLSGAGHGTAAQDAVKRRKPVVVSHLSAENKALLRRPAAPKHNTFSKVICFKVKCRGYIGWRERQRKMRFKGYKDGGKVPAPGKKPATQEDTMITVSDTVIVKPSPPLPLDTTVTKDQIFVLDEVLFELNSARFNSQFIFKLDSLVQLLLAHKNLMAKISGHTDNTGNTAHNLKLSNDRAAAVADYLIKNEISRNRISFEGLGSTRPIADNKTEEGRRKNRRVEILLSE